MAMWRHRRSPTNVTIEHAYSGTSDGGVFVTTSPVATELWPWDDAMNARLDDVYLNVRSGGKFASPYIIKILKNISAIVYPTYAQNGILPAVSRTDISHTIANRFYMKWAHLFDEIYSANYSPLNVVNTTETREHEGSNINTRNMLDTTTRPSKTTQTSSTRTPNLTETTSGSVTSTVETDGTVETEYGKVVTAGGSNTATNSHSEFGFNTNPDPEVEGPVPISVDTRTETPRETSTESGSDTVTTDMTDTTRETDSSTVTETGSEAVLASSSESYAGNEVLAKTGTDSVATEDSVTITRQGTLFRPPAELLTLDRDLWLWDFFEIVFDDVDSILTLYLYSDSPVERFYWGQEIN